MKKIGISFLLGFCWMLSIGAQFSFAAAPFRPDPSRQTVISEIQEVPDFYRTSSDTPKTPPFEIDWSLLGKLNSNWVPDFFREARSNLAPSFFQKSKALFDVKALFIQFFYTW